VITQIAHIAPQQLSSSAATSQSHSALVIYIVIVHCTPLRLLQVHQHVQVAVHAFQDLGLSERLGACIGFLLACMAVMGLHWPFVGLLILLVN
jgi:hypothetical protein